MNTERDALLIRNRYERAMVAELERKFGSNMPPSVKALLTEKKAVVAALGEKLKR